jgi:hypothetical protein
VLLAFISAVPFAVFSPFVAVTLFIRKFFLNATSVVGEERV